MIYNRLLPILSYERLGMISRATLKITECGIFPATKANRFSPPLCTTNFEQSELYPMEIVDFAPWYLEKMLQI